MKKILLLLSIIVFITTAANAETKNANIEITIEGIKEKKGMILATLHNQEQGFPDKNAILTKVVSADAKITAITFQNMPSGTYAFAIYHDKNKNGKLDKGAFGIPKEPYAFSNNARRKTGPAKFKKANFPHNSTTTHQTVTIK